MLNFQRFLSCACLLTCLNNPNALAQSVASETRLDQIFERQKPNYALPAAAIDAIALEDIDHQSVYLSHEPFHKKVLLIVNTASRCGFTPQYASLVKLYHRYRQQGLVVLGFPCNDYGQQEPLQEPAIKNFCTDHYAVDFPMFSKITLKGKKIHPLFQLLIAQSPDQKEVAWNFEKFLVGRDHQLLGRFASSVDPLSPQLIAKIEEALK